MTHTVLTATGLFTPPSRITNDELVHSFNTWVRQENAKFQSEMAQGLRPTLEESNAAFIVKASGIEARHVLDKEGTLDPNRMCPRLPIRPPEALSIQGEMCVAAAQEALERAQIAPSDIDVTLVACSNLQRPYPAVSIEVQQALGCSGFAFDMNVACSSATFGLQQAHALIQSGMAQRVLMLNPEICSAHLNFRDRDSHFIFGDACTAVVVERSDLVKNPKSGWRILSTRAQTQFSNNIRNDFGFLNRTAPESHRSDANDTLFRQQGRKVFKEVVPMVVAHISQHLSEVKLDPRKDLQRFWLHQANLSMNQLIAEKLLGRTPSEDEAPVILKEYANTSSAGSVIAFHSSQHTSLPNDKGLLCSFGAGYSVGSVLLEKNG